MRIRWTDPAARDLTHICDYIDERDGPQTARRVALTIHQGVSSLTQFPHRGRPGRKLHTRELVFPACLTWLSTAFARTPLKSTAFCTARRTGLSSPYDAFSSLPNASAIFSETFSPSTPSISSSSGGTCGAVRSSAMVSFQSMLPSPGHRCES